MYDILQPVIGSTSYGSTGQSVIQLSATDLVNSTADAHGFTVNSSSNQICYVSSGQALNTGKRYYIFAGVNTASIADTIVSSPFAKKTIIYSMSAYCNHQFTTNEMNVNLYNSSKFDGPTAGTQFASLVLKPENSGPTGVPLVLQNFSSTFNPGSNFLTVELLPLITLPSSNYVVITLASY